MPVSMRAAFYCQYSPSCRSLFLQRVRVSTDTQAQRRSRPVPWSPNAQRGAGAAPASGGPQVRAAAPHGRLLPGGSRRSPRPCGAQRRRVRGSPRHGPASAPPARPGPALPASPRPQGSR